MPVFDPANYEGQDRLSHIEKYVQINSANVSSFSVADKRFAGGATVYPTAAAAVTGLNATAAINAAITAANSAGGGVVPIPGWVRCAGGANAITMLDNVTLQGIGKGQSGIVFDDVAGTPITAIATRGANKTPLATITLGDRSTTITSSGLAAGDWVFINDATAFRSWIVRVHDVVAGTPDTINFEEYAPNTFTTASTIAKITLIENVQISDLTLRTPTGKPTDLLNLRSGFVNLQGCLNPTIKNIEVIGMAADTSGLGIGVQMSRGVEVTGNRFSYCGDSDITPTQNTRVLEVRDSTQVTVTDNRFRRSGGSGAISFTAVCYMHADRNMVGGFDLWINRPDPSAYADDGGGRGIKLVNGCNFFTVNGNVVHDSGFDGIRVEDCRFGTVCDNTAYRARDVSINIAGTGSSVTGPLDHVVVSGNVIKSPSSAAGGTHGLTVTHGQYITVDGNEVTDLALGPGIYLDASTTDSIVKGNTIDTITGNGIQLNTGCTRVSVKDNRCNAVSGNNIDTTNSLGGNTIGFNEADDTTYQFHANDTLLLSTSPGFATLTYSASMTPTSHAGHRCNYLRVTITDAVAHTINNPSGTGGWPTDLYFEIFNNTVGAVAVTGWGGAYRLPAWVAPAAGKRKTVQFHFDGTFYNQVALSADF